MASNALYDAGEITVDKNIGVYTAAWSAEFERPLPSFLIARLIAFEIAVDGPLLNSEAACASGYLSVYHAAQHLVDGTCHTAVVAGVSLQNENVLRVLDPISSKSSIMRPLDEQADGMVHGEACGAVVLQSCTHPIETQYSQLVGWSASQNSSLLAMGTADLGQMQLAAELALTVAGLAKESIALCHLHAMGNLASDGPEVMAMQLALAGSESTNPLLLLGHKANFGHSVSAAGIMAVITTTLAVTHQSVPVHLNVSRPIAMIAETPTLDLPTERSVKLKPAYEALAASISGTSFSGDNSHLVVRAVTELSRGIDCGLPSTSTATVAKQGFAETPAKLDCHFKDAWGSTRIDSKNASWTSSPTGRAARASSGLARSLGGDKC